MTCDAGDDDNVLKIACAAFPPASLLLIPVNNSVGCAGRQARAVNLHDNFSDELQREIQGAPRTEL